MYDYFERQLSDQREDRNQMEKGFQQIIQNLGRKLAPKPDENLRRLQGRVFPWHLKWNVPFTMPPGRTRTDAVRTSGSAWPLLDVPEKANPRGHRLPDSSFTI